MRAMRVRSVLSVLLLSAAAALGSAGSAQAALYTGNYDPAYGGIFPELGWQASALFDVPESCLAIGTGNNIPISGPCAGFDVLSAEVSFYNVANPNTILNSYALDPNVIVNGINLAGGHLAGIDTGFFDFFVSATADRRERPVFVQPDLVRRKPGAADLCQSAADLAWVRVVSGARCQLRYLSQCRHRRVRSRF